MDHFMALSPTRHMININDGRINGTMMLLKDQMIGLWLFCNV